MHGTLLFDNSRPCIAGSAGDAYKPSAAPKAVLLMDLPFEHPQAVQARQTS